MTMRCKNGEAHTHETITEARQCWGHAGHTGPRTVATLAQPVATDSRPATEGMYRKNGQIYKVQKAVHGSGRLYAKVLLLATVDGHPVASFDLVKGMVAKLTQADRMTEAEAAEFGQLYGVCVRCGAVLTDEDSRDRGIGPVCATKI